MNKQPNLVLIMCDQFRGDAIAYKGHPDVLTPNLDTLAQNGVNFNHMYSATPSCIPARVTLFTGKQAKHNKRVGYEEGIPWNYENMLPQLLSDAGYQTQAIGKLHVHPPRRTCGFNHVLLHDGHLSYYRNSELPYHLHQSVHDDYLRFLKNEKGIDADVTETGIDPNSWIARPWPYEERLHPTNWVTTESIDFLRKRDRDRPFFLMSSYVRPHQPFDAPQPFFDYYKGKALREPFVGNWEKDEKTNEFGFIKNSIYGTHQKMHQQLAMEGYYACISHVDHQIGRLLNALQEDGDMDNTVILFLSDHGELMFDHHTYRKVFPYQGSINVPLIISAGKDVNVDSDSLVELCDILPTLLDFAGVAIPDDLDGRSLKQAVLNQVPLDRKYIHGEHAFHSQLSNQFIVTKTDKYIWYSESGVEQYFDLKNDPNELTNLIDDHDAQERIDVLRKLLIKELSGRQEGFVVDNKLTPIKNPVDTLD